MDLADELVAAYCRPQVEDSSPPKYRAAFAGDLMACVETPPAWLEEAFPKLLDSVPRTKRAELFTRWLFVQPRGEDVAQRILLVTWREAKPCANAIAAVVSGNVEAQRLRKDSKRPELPAIDGNSTRRVTAAMFKMVVVVDKRSQEMKVAKYIQSSPEGLDISVARSPRDLTDLLLVRIDDDFSQPGDESGEHGAVRQMQAVLAAEPLARPDPMEDLTQNFAGKAAGGPFVHGIAPIGGMILPPPGLAPPPVSKGGMIFDEPRWGRLARPVLASPPMSPLMATVPTPAAAPPLGCGPLRCLPMYVRLAR